MPTSQLNKLVEFTPPTNTSSILIYANTNSSRLNYVCKFIFNSVLKLNYVITEDEIYFRAHTGFKLNYSNSKINNCTITPHPFIQEATPGIEIDKFSFTKNTQLYFCKTECALGYDIFSAVFLCLSRIEEYGNYKKDQHQRFEAKESIFYKHNSLLKPVVDVWITEFKKEFQTFYPEIKIEGNKVTKISTIDIDNLYAFKHKGFLRSIGGVLKDLVNGRFNHVFERIQVAFGKKDSFDVYEVLNNYHSKNNSTLVYFFLLNNNNQFDRTVNPNSLAFKAIISNITKSNHSVGLHPSYYSSNNKKQLKKEIEKISELLEKNVKLSRQHYLIFDIKTTPKLLIEQGIMVDFTMGFASQAGFRAGTSYPFHYFDFETNSELPLISFPFCLMDGAYTVYNKEKSILKDSAEILNTLNEVGGYFTTVFHERSFSELHFGKFSKVYWDLH